MFCLLQFRQYAKNKNENNTWLRMSFQWAWRRLYVRDILKTDTFWHLVTTGRINGYTENVLWPHTLFTHWFLLPHFYFLVLCDIWNQSHINLEMWKKCSTRGNTFGIVTCVLRIMQLTLKANSLHCNFS